MILNTKVEVLYGFFGNFGLRDAFQERNAPKSIEIDKDKHSREFDASSVNRAWYWVKRLRLHFEMSLSYAVQGAPKIFTPWGFLIIFPKRLRIFKQNFTRLLSIQIYANLQNFIQLSLTLTKLCRIKRDHPPNFYISQHVHHEFY